MTEFVVRPFAFMRLTHEALRAGFESIQESATRGDLAAVRKDLAALRGVIALHARQEEEVFFPLLDSLFDGAVEKAELRHAHLREHHHEAELDAALESGDLDAVQAAIDAWGPDFEKHLAEEEQVMMPLTQKVSETLEGRAQAVRDIMAIDWDELRDVQLPYVVRSLSANRPYGMLRMFVAAVQLASADQFGTLEPVIVAALSEQHVATLRDHGHLTS